MIQRVKNALKKIKKRRSALVDYGVLIIFFWCSAVFYSINEEWSFLSSVFFIINTVTTVGLLTILNIKF